MEIIVIFAIIQKIFYWIFRPIYYVLSFRPKPKLPPIKSPLLEMSAVQIAKKIRNGEIKSKDIVDACIERIKEVNPILNAIVQDRFKDAQKEADEVDNYIAANKNNMAKIEIEKPLLGVPCTIKESCGLKGMSLAGGCLPLKGRIAAEDGEAVKELRKAGAIPLAVTNTPELCLGGESNNLITGRTRNPYNYHRTSGGSSGGEGAIIASGASLFGIGSDLAGSIRVPSLFNGIFGHKPTPGYVSLEGHFSAISDIRFQKHMVIGPMARYADDLSLLFKVLCADKAYLLNLDEKVDLNEINIFFVEEGTKAWYAVPVATEIKDRMRDAVLYMKTAYGCHTERGPFDDELSISAEIANAIILGIEGMDDLFQFSSKKDKLNSQFEIIKAIFGLSEFSVMGTVFNLVFRNKLFSKEIYRKYYKLNEAFKIKFQKVLKENGVLLYPTFPLPAIEHNQLYNVLHGSMYCMIVNAMELPATHVPLGLNKEGLPIGIQVIAAPNQDRLCLAVARALEERFGGWTPPPA